MSKQVTFNDTSIKEFSVSRDDNGYIISCSFGLVDADGIEWTPKRITIKEIEMTTAQKAKITALENIIKTIIDDREL